MNFRKRASSMRKKSNVIAPCSTILSFLLLVMINYPSVTTAQNATPNYWRCEKAVSGDWVFGRAPKACNASSFIDLNYLDKTYPGMSFSDLVDNKLETSRYMPNLYAVIRDVAKYYITKRRPTVSNEELEEWVHAVLAIAHQESYWSHFRRATDQEIKLMRGDYGHGHGIMQVDDRWHFVAVNNGSASGLVSNMIYSLEEYFSAWETAPKKSCVGSPTNYKARARSAYSAYNGGIAKICRWTNPSDKWARNDVGYLSKYTQKQWENYLNNASIPAPINVACIADTNENCELPGPIPTEDSSTEESLPRSGIFYQTSDGHYCTFSENRFHCLSGQKNLVCLEELVEKSLEIKSYPMPPEFLNKYDFAKYDIHNLCLNKISNLYSVGSPIRINKNINLRATSAGEIIATATAGATVQVLDYIIKNYKIQDRYYYIKYNNLTGYIYAGKTGDTSSWTTKFEGQPKNKIISTIRESLTTSNDETKVYREIDGEILDTLPPNRDFIVEEVVAYGPNNNLYFRTNIDGEKGYLYAGTIFPKISIEKFETNTSKAEFPQTEEEIGGVLKSSIWYRYLEKCSSSNCGRTKTVVWGKLSPTHFIIIDETDNMYKVIISKNKEVGWLKKNDVIKL